MTDVAAIDIFMKTDVSSGKLSSIFPAFVSNIGSLITCPYQVSVQTLFVYPLVEMKNSSVETRGQAPSGPFSSFFLIQFAEISFASGTIVFEKAFGGNTF